MDICKHKATFLGSKSPYILYQTNGWNLLTSGAFGKSIYFPMFYHVQKKGTF